MEAKKRVTQEDIAKACKIDQGSVSRILNEDTRDSFAEETIQKVFKVARELGYLHPSLITSNRRESNRRKAELTGKVQVLIGTNTVYDEGDIDIDEISMSGMLLRNFRTKKRSLPMDRFKFNVEVTEGRLKGFKCRCKLVRFSDNEDEFALAVKFDSLDEDAKDKLKNFIR
ncbi:MAG TPA: PilZ domain-containing protein [Planctomycetota bacterium]|nr:PilZ domain-containing protein [Planctomycetota bacterium]